MLVYFLFCSTIVLYSLKMFNHPDDYCNGNYCKTIMSIMLAFISLLFNGFVIYIAMKNKSLIPIYIILQIFAFVYMYDCLVNNYSLCRLIITYVPNNLNDKKKIINTVSTCCIAIVISLMIMIMGMGNYESLFGIFMMGFFYKKLFELSG